MFANEGWSAYMSAPWGKFDKASVEAKEAAKKQYDKDTAAFWAHPSRKMSEPTTK